MQFKILRRRVIRSPAGIELVPATGQPQPTAFIKSIVKYRAYTWYMAHVSKDVFEALSCLGYLEPLNLDAALRDLPAQFKTPHYATEAVVQKARMAVADIPRIAAVPAAGDESERSRTT